MGNARVVTFYFFLLRDFVWSILFGMVNVFIWSYLGFFIFRVFGVLNEVIFGM